MGKLRFKNIRSVSQRSAGSWYTWIQSRISKITKLCSFFYAETLSLGIYSSPGHWLGKKAHEENSGVFVCLFFPFCYLREMGCFSTTLIPAAWFSLCPHSTLGSQMLSCVGTAHPVSCTSWVSASVGEGDRGTLYLSLFVQARNGTGRHPTQHPYFSSRI